MALLAAMMACCYWRASRFALRSWDAGDANGRRTADRRSRELPAPRARPRSSRCAGRTRMAAEVRLRGRARSACASSPRAPPAHRSGGLALVGLEVEAGRGPRRAKPRHAPRACPTTRPRTSSPLDAASPRCSSRRVGRGRVRVLRRRERLHRAALASTRGHSPARIPQLVRVRVRTADGTEVPDIVARMMLGEEAGCLENAFQRVCRPRSR